MAILPTVGRRSWGLRATIAAIYLLLTAGAVTMVVPFAVVLAGSVSNEADYERHDAVPRWLWRRDLRFAKYLAEKYRGARFEHFAAAHRAPAGWSTFHSLGQDPTLPERLLRPARIPPAAMERIVADYREFLAGYDPGNCLPAFPNWERQAAQRYLREKYRPVGDAANPLPSNAHPPPPTRDAGPPRAAGVEAGSDVHRAVPANAPDRLGTASPFTGGLPSVHPIPVEGEPAVSRTLRRSRRADSDAAALEAMNRAWDEGAYGFWDLIKFSRETRYPFHLPRWIPPDEPRFRDFQAFVAARPADRKLPVTARYLWSVYLLAQGARVERLDREYGTAFGSVFGVPPGDRADLPPPLRAAWERFVSDAWPLRLVELSPADAAGFAAFLRARFGDVARMNRELGTRCADFTEAGAPTVLPATGAWRRLWIEFAATVPADRRTRLSVERAYGQFLAARYGRIEALNAACGWSLAAFEQAEPPQAELDWHDFATHEAAYALRFATSNFGEVLEYIAGRGRALWNTLALVALTIGFTLIVNPLAAYALSRFRLRATQQILVYLLATMAFPPEVGMIPGFLMLKDLGMLNTFAALVLPGLANGYSVFLLKGFFDSLPRELYEAASLEGASEPRVFWQITLPLSRPILAVIALQAFIQAYGSFMWAFVTCQDPNMWTLTVWLYQFQIASPPHLVMAALVLASVPTLAVFVVCQKIILRGVVIPAIK
jgi:multiple sugar transport system permease protein